MLPSSPLVARSPGRTGRARPVLETRPFLWPRLCAPAHDTLHCPARAALAPTEQRREADGCLRACLRYCRPCRVREHCQWHGQAAKHPLRVSLLLHPLAVASALLLWRVWGQRTQWRACIDLVRGNGWRFIWHLEALPAHLPRPCPCPASSTPIDSCPARRDWRAMPVPPAAARMMIHLFGVPEAFARFMDLATV